MIRAGQPAGDVAVLVPAAGAGVRFGADRPKALYPLAGEPLVVHAVRRLTGAPAIGPVVVAAPRAHLAAFRSALPQEVTVIAGGGERQESVAAALAALPDEVELVLVHDAARALVPPELVTRVVQALRAGHDAVVPVLPLADTIVEVGGDDAVAAGLDRSRLRAVQTPQGFRRSVLVAAHAGANGVTATDDAGLAARIGVRVHTVPGSPVALKVTTRFDLAVAEAQLSGSER